MSTIAHSCREKQGIIPWSCEHIITCDLVLTTPSLHLHSRKDQKKCRNLQLKKLEGSVSLCGQKRNRVSSLFLPRKKLTQKQHFELNALNYKLASQPSYLSGADHKASVEWTDFHATGLHCDLPQVSTDHHDNQKEKKWFPTHPQRRPRWNAVNHLSNPPPTTRTQTKPTARPAPVHLLPPQSLPRLPQDAPGEAGLPFPSAFHPRARSHPP